MSGQTIATDLDILIIMGFDREAAMDAMKITLGDRKAAIAILTSQKDKNGRPKSSSVGAWRAEHQGKFKSKSKRLYLYTAGI